MLLSLSILKHKTAMLAALVQPRESAKHDQWRNTQQ